jgi:hypothetical protein
MKKLMPGMIAILVILAISCKKNSEEPVLVEKIDYYQLKTGNYWIYEGFRIDTSGIATSTGKYDSAYIEKDTTIRGLTYFKLLENPYLIFPEQVFMYLRDSSGYLVNSSGAILASDNNFTDILAVDTGYMQLYVGYLKMTGKDSVVTVSANTFQSITSSRQIVPSPPNLAQLPVRPVYDIYGKGAGKVKSHTFFYSGVMSMEARLIRYKVK